MQPSGAPSSTLLNHRYRLLAVIAGGGMATVYKAQDTMLNRVVAVKIPRGTYATNPDFVRRFNDEARAAANLNHPNIVSIYDVGKDVVNDVERQYLVMEYVEGQDLKLAIRNAYASSQPLGIDEAVNLARQICEGVGYAHRRGLVHCDLKPQNVLVSTDGRAKVTDFGIARAYTAAVAENADVVWGTPQYYAPEQAQGQPPTPASDVYAIGVMMFEMLSGRLPFNGRTAADLANQHMTADVPALHELNPLVSLQLESIVRRALSKDPAQRYRDADQFARVLAAYAQQGEEQTIVGTGASAAAAAAVSQRSSSVAAPSAASSAAAGAQPPAPAAKSSPQPGPSSDGGGVDVLLWLLGAIAILCVLGLVGLYAVVLGRFNSPPPNASNATVTPAGTRIADSTASPTRQSVTTPTAPATTPTPPSVNVPSDLLGRIYDEPLSATLRAVGWNVALTNTLSLAPEKTILGVTPPGGSALSVSGTLTLTLSTGGRSDVQAKLPPITLDSVRMAQEVFGPGQLVPFEVRWTAQGRPQRNYKVFVHVWGPGNAFIQPDDREPRNAGQPAPTSSWVAGTVVNDAYSFALPGNAPRGQYRIEVGLYDPSNANQRLRVSDYGKTPVNSAHPDAVIVRTIEVR